MLLTMIMVPVAALWAVADGGAPASPSLLRAPAPVNASGREPSAEQYRLQRANDKTGDLLYEDAPGFSARVARDGTVTFHNKHASVWHMLPLLPSPPPRGVPTLEGVIRSHGRNVRKAGATPDEVTADETRWPATTVSRYRPDPREACQYPRSCFFEASVVMLGPGAKLDVTDEIMRMVGQDPYRYEKARFLTATRELRIRMAGRSHAEDVQRSVAELPRQLDMIICDDRLTLSERRAIIEALRAELDSSSEAIQSADEIKRALGKLDASVKADAGAVCPH
ncbi:MAG TPA: hypothetical protein VNO55_28910 [Polyangia bacterium]|nr:hypothetical protein [Polyangia bacterium]